MLGVRVRVRVRLRARTNALFTAGGGPALRGGGSGGVGPPVRVR